MRRSVTCVIVMALLAGACAGTAAPTEPPTAPPSSSTTTTASASSSTTSSSTTSSSTTTTAPPTLKLDGAGAALTRVVRALYASSMGEKPPRAPEGVVKAFAQAEGRMPLKGKASVATYEKGVKLAAVKVGNDVTLAVADPKWRIVGGWWPSIGVDKKLGRFPKIVAVVGSDARPDERRDETRADSIHFVGIDAKGNAGLVGVPRDAWVPIPGVGSTKINASLFYGGPDLMMETFSDVTGLDFDGYLLTGFAGFEGLIDVLGGLMMDVPQDFDDSAAKAYLEAGRQMLTAAEALAVSRTRKTLLRGDFQRQEHGGLVMMAAQSMLRANTVLGLPRVIAGSRPHVSTDMPLDQLFRLAAAVVRVKPDRVVNVVAPGGTGSVGGASVVFLSSSADQLWDDLADGSLEPADE